jgi:tetratricopeptide (TPR) repeat protein
LKALEGAGNDHRVVRLQVDILNAQGRLDDAAAVIDKVLAESPDALPFLQFASIVHMKQGKLDLAGQRLDQALKLAPDDPITHHYVGQLELSRPQPDFSKAIPHFAKGASNSSALAMESGFALAECHRQLGSYQAQVAALEDVLRKHPNSARAKLTLADAYLALSPPRNTDAMALVRDLKTSLKGPDAAEALAREARILLAEGKTAEAVASISAAQAARPDDLRLTRQALETLLEARRFADVDQRVAELVAKDKNLWWAYEARAVSKRQQNDREAAIKDFEAALAAADAAQNVPAAQDIILKMGDVIGFNEAINRIQARAEKEDRWKLVLARLQQLGGDNASAIRTMEDVLTRADQLAPATRAEALRFAGTAYLVAKDSEKATQAYTRLLEVSDRDTTALNNLAYLLTESVSPPRPQEALKYSQRAYDLAMQQGMRDPLVLDTHGWILASAGKVDEGIDVLRRSIEIRATPDAHYHLGESYLRKQFAQEGKRELEKALELINRAKQEKQPVDAVLEQRIVEAIARASVMTSGQEPGRPAGARGLEGAPTAPTASSDAP